MSQLGERYAEALIGIAREQNALEDFRSELTAFSDEYSSDRQLRDFLEHPGRRRQTKREFLSAVLNERFHPETIHLILLLLDKGRLSFLPDICAEYGKMADQLGNILPVTIVSGTPLQQPQIDAISEKFQTLYHADSVRATVRLDPALIGGVKVSAGGRLYDGTAKGRLERLRSLLSAGYGKKNAR